MFEDVISSTTYSMQNIILKDHHSQKGMLDFTDHVIENNIAKESSLVQESQPVTLIEQGNLLLISSIALTENPDIPPQWHEISVYG